MEKKREKQIHVHYSLEIADEIISEISKGCGLQEICERPGFPSSRAVYDWLDKYPDFAALMARAMEQQGDVFAAKIGVLAQKAEKGEILPDQAKVAGALYQWLASKRRPKVYGDKMTLAGDAENPLFHLGKRLDDMRQKQLAMLDVTPWPVIEGKVEIVNAPGADLC